MTHVEFREALRKLGWSQVHAASELGINPRTSRRYASGESKIPLQIELMLKEALGKPMTKEQMVERVMEIGC